MLQCKIMLVNAAKPDKLVNMSGAVLTITSKNYSSWSLRGWLLCRMAGLDFEEELLSHDDPSARAELLLLSPSFLVPRLTHNGRKIWDTLAMITRVTSITGCRMTWAHEPIAGQFQAKCIPAFPTCVRRCR